MEVIRRKNKYYYLKHSYRKKNRIASKEIYLGKTIPKNIDQIKSNFLKQLKQPLYLKLNHIKDNYRKEWKKIPQSVKKELLIDFSINFTYNTNAIEGSTITKPETEDLIKRKIAPNKSLRDVQETINHSKTFLEMLNHKSNLTLTLILMWHKKIFSETKPDIAGRLRDYNVRVGNHRCPDWQEVKQLMQDFFRWYSKNKTKEHPVELAAQAHHRFVKIHPFGDGNGRITRLITNFILNKFHYPLIVIEYKNRKSYYRALNKADEKGENIFVQYFTRRYLKQHKENL